MTEPLSVETFSFADVILGRSYPEEVVHLCTDEATAYARGKYLDEVIEKRGDTAHLMLIGSKQAEAKRAAYQRAIDEDPEVKAKVAEFDKKLAAATYEFHIKGISDDLLKELHEKSLADIPVEYERWKNPIDGRQMKEEKPSPERDRHFTNLIWAAYITKIVSPDGRVDVAPGIAAAEAVRRMPQAQIAKFNEAINKLSVDSAAFEASVTSDFSPAS